MGKSTRKFAIGTLVAGLAGYVTGVLTAPKSGKDTRKDIKDNVDRGWAEAEKELKSLHTELAKKLDEIKVAGQKVSGRAQGEIDASLDKARDAKEKVREMLSAIHEGDAKDEDLQRAIKEAKLALDHIKDYFKK